MPKTFRGQHQCDVTEIVFHPLASFAPSSLSSKNSDYENEDDDEEDAPATASLVKKALVLKFHQRLNADHHSLLLREDQIMNVGPGQRRRGNNPVTFWKTPEPNVGKTGLRHRRAPFPDEFQVGTRQLKKFLTTDGHRFTRINKWIRISKTAAKR